MTLTKILSGKDVCKSVYTSLEERITRLKAKRIVPGLAVILVGENPASQVYVRSKSRRFERLSLYSETFAMPNTTSEKEILKKIRELNTDDRFHGILVQLPLPNHINEDAVLREVSPLKDVDGFHPENIGRLAIGNPRFIPCTPKGIMRILEFYDIDLSGKHVVIIGRSNIVGRPLSFLTSQKKSLSNATTTICHSKTPDIRYFTKQADVVIAAIGVSQFVDETYIKQGAILIDVGINQIPNDSDKKYRLVGDVFYDRIDGIAGAVTPVPGGVGPMTIAMLVENTVESAETRL